MQQHSVCAAASAHHQSAIARCLRFSRHANLIFNACNATKSLSCKRLGSAPLHKVLSMASKPPARNSRKQPQTARAVSVMAALVGVDECRSNSETDAEPADRAQGEGRKARVGDRPGFALRCCAVPICALVRHVFVLALRSQQEPGFPNGR